MPAGTSSNVSGSFVHGVLSKDSNWVPPFFVILKRCLRGILWPCGKACKHPFSTVASSNASQNPTQLLGCVYKKVESW